MILFSGKYANRFFAPEDWQHAYGFILGKQHVEGEMDVIRFLPSTSGSKLEQSMARSTFNLDEKLGEFEDGLSVCGFFHSAPNRGNVLSEMDKKSLQSYELNTVCILFDFTKVDQYNNGFFVYQYDGNGISDITYTISHPEEEDKFYLARSLVDLSEKYELSGTISADFLHFEEKYKNPPITINNDDVTEESRQETTPHDPNNADFQEFELTLIDQDFEIQKLRHDIEIAREEGVSSAYFKIQLANRLIERMANDSEILKYLESAEEEFIADSDSESKMGLAIVKNELGLFYEDRGNLYTALNYFDDSLKILGDLADNSRKIRVLNNIGNIYLQLNNYEIALNKYMEAYEKSNNLIDKVSIFSNIADVHIKLQNYDRAYSILMKNVEFFQETHNDYGLSHVFSKLGRLYFEQGSNHYPIALKYSQLALEIKKKREFYRECIEDYELLSIIYFNQKSYRFAEDNLIQGLNLVRSLGFEQKEAFFYEHLGELYLREEKIRESVDYYKLAAESCSEFGEKESEGEIWEKIGDIYLYRLHELNDARDFYEHALENYKEENIRRKKADILVKIAEIHIDLNEPNSAIEYLQKAKKLYKIMYDDTSANIVTERINSLEY